MINDQTSTSAIVSLHFWCLPSNLKWSSPWPVFPSYLHKRLHLASRAAGPAQFRAREIRSNAHHPSQALRCRMFSVFASLGTCKSNQSVHTGALAYSKPQVSSAQCVAAAWRLGRLARYAVAPPEVAVHWPRQPRRLLIVFMIREMTLRTGFATSLNPLANSSRCSASQVERACSLLQLSAFWLRFFPGRRSVWTRSCGRRCLRLVTWLKLTSSTLHSVPLVRFVGHGTQQSVSEKKNLLNRWWCSVLFLLQHHHPLTG